MGMTKREDTIERIERVLKLTHKESITVTIPRLTAERAVSMLKKQEAVAPTVKINGYGTRFYYCPNCNREFYCHNQWDNYCANCGQAVKWE